MLGDLFNQGDEDENVLGSSGAGKGFVKMKKPPQPRASVNFVGLENQGATCYLNSLIQSMFMTPELRTGLFGIDPNDLGVDLVSNYEQEAAEEVKKGVIEPDEGLMSTLTSMGIPEHHAVRALQGTKNGSLDEVFNYIEAHENDAEFNKPLVDPNEGKKKRKKPRFIPIELQRLFSQLQLSDRLAVSTDELTTKGFQWQNMDGQVQHDAHELNRLLIDALEKSLKRTSGETLCRTLYEGNCVNQIKCLTCLGVSERSEPYYDINLQIIDCKDMCVSLRRHCAAELLTGESAYQCDTCRVKRQALRSTVLRTLPQVLTFSCSRFRIDRSTNWTRVKVTSRSEFPLIMDMLPFSEAGSANEFRAKDAKGSASGNVHDPLHANPEVEADFVQSLRNNNNIVWLAKVLRNTESVAKELVEQYGENARFADVDEAQYEAIARHLTPHMFSETAPEASMLYQLHAVIMHRGSAHSGHYFAYIRDNLGEGEWSLPDLEAPASAASVGTTDTTSGSVSAATTPAAEDVPTSQVSSHKMYVKESPSGTYLVDEASPLGVIIKIMNAGPVAKSRSNAAPNQAGKQGKFNKNASGASAALPSCKVSYLSAEIATKARGSWGTVYKPKYGAFDPFLRAQADLLRVNGKDEVELLTSKIKLVSTAVYQRAQNLHKPANASLKSPSSLPVPPTAASAHDEALVNADETLARSLQVELDIARHQEHDNATAVSVKKDTEWETAGVPKRKTDKLSVEKPEDNTKTMDAVKLQRIKVLAAEIFSHFYGNFFEFNDSMVLPIAASRLERAFEGSDSAYLLVYRQLAAPVEISAFLAQSRQKLLQADKKPPVAPSPPAFFEKEVLEQNEILRQERLKYEQSFSNVRVSVVCPAQVSYRSPLLFPAAPPASAASTIEENNTTAPESAFFDVEIDSRKTLAELKMLFAEQHQDKVWGLGLPPNAAARAVSLLERFGEGYYVLENFPDDTPIGDVLNRRSTADSVAGPPTLLLWDGRTINGERVLTGMEGYPKLLSVSLLVPPDAQEHALRGKQTVQESKLFPALYLPNTLTLLEFAHRLCDLCSVPRLRACISVLCVVNASIPGNIAKLEKQFTSTVLYNQGIISGKALVGSAPHSSTVVSTAAAAGMLLTSHSALGEFEALSYVLLEDCESRGLQGKSLVDEFVLHKNSQWTVTVELDFTPPVGFEDTSNGTIQFDLSKFSTVEDLRHQALEIFALLDSCRDTTRLRLGANRGEMVLDDETLNLTAAGLKNHSILYLELGARPPSDSLLLTVVLVAGNSTESKYTAEEAGQRLQEVELAAHINDTVQSVRDRAGVLLLGYAEGWTHRSGALLQGSGVRDHRGEELVLPPPVIDADAATEGGAAPQAIISDAVAEEPAPVVADPRALAQVEFGEAFQGRRLRRTSWLKEFTDLAVETAEDSAGHKTSTVADSSKQLTKAAQRNVTPPADAIVAPVLLTLKDMGLKSGDTLLLEEGTLPVKGQMTIPLYVWQAEPKMTSALADQSEALSALEAATHLRRACLVPLGAVDVRESMSLDDLQALVHALLNLQDTYLREELAEWVGAVDKDNFLLRELRADLLPGRSYWTSEATGPTPTAVSDAKATKTAVVNNPAAPATAPAKASAKQGRNKGVGNKPSEVSAEPSPAPTSAAAKTAVPAPGNTCGSVTLKKLGLRGERGLVVELLKDSQARSRPPAGAFRVWVQELLNPGAAEGQALVSPSWPPRQVLINGGTAPTLGHLKRALTAAFPHLSTDTLCAYKYLPPTIEWSAVVYAGAGAQAVKKKGESNITQGPYFVKEGDQFACFDVKAVRFGPGVAAPVDNIVKFALPEDIELRMLRDHERAERKLKKQYKSVMFDTPGQSVSANNKPARKEVMLSLGSGFDFSDDED